MGNRSFLTLIAASEISTLSATYTYNLTVYHHHRGRTLRSARDNTLSAAMSARYRGPGGDPAAAPEPSKPIKEVADASGNASSAGVSVLDVLRVIGGIIILVTGVSYLSTSGESMTWGYNAWWTRAREWKGILVRPLLPPTPHFHNPLKQPNS